MAGRLRVAVGSHVVFEGRAWQVVGLEGALVRLVDGQGASAVVLLGHLVAGDDFAVSGVDEGVGVPQWGLFESVPLREQERALAWQRHIREVECGLPGGVGSEGEVREQYDPLRHSMAERETAKAQELAALGWPSASRSTVTRMRARYRRHGLWGLVDHRATRASSPTGRSDERVVAAVLEALRRQRGRSKGTVSGLRRLAMDILQERHGHGVVAVPSPSTFSRLVKALADPQELPGRPARTAAGPARPFTAGQVLRIGEQVMVDTTRLDVMAVFADGITGRPELTIALDVASRSILAAVLRPAGTKAVDAALLLAEMAVPHPVRPGWAKALEMSRASIPYERLLSLDARLDQAAARPVVVPETVVVDRGKIFISEAFLAACETLGVSVQSAPPRQPAAKGPVERTFSSINTLFAQYVAGYTGSDVTRRGRDVEGEAVWSLPQLQDLLDEWITCGWQVRPHEGLRHPLMPAAALSPNEVWGALLAVCGYVPLPLRRRDYLELLPVKWQAITDRGIRLGYRTYDDAVLNPYRGRPSGVTARRGRWEVHYNPHDARQVWVRLPDGELAEVGWIHREAVLAPFGDHTWQHIKNAVPRRAGREEHEAELAHALDELLRRARTGTGSDTEHRVAGRILPIAGGLPAQATAPTRRERQELPLCQGAGESLDGLAAHTGIEDEDGLEEHFDDDTQGVGFGLYDTDKEAERW